MTEITGGTAYYPDHWPEADWERDLRLIKSSGLDVVRFGEFSWTWFEPEEGRFDFSGYDRFMDIAHKVGLRVILCTPTAAPPLWLLKNYPGMLMLDQHGHPHNSGRHMACFNHPDFRRVAGNTILTLANRFRNHPALEGWQIDNEPTMGESASADRMYDYNPHTAGLFKKHLLEKYDHDLDALNKRWYNSFWSRAYTSWDQVEPPVLSECPSLWLEWLRFREQNVAQFVEWQLRLLRNVREDFLIGTNIPECGPLGSTALAQDYWKQAEGLDYVGTDIYCYMNDDYAERKMIGYVCDMIRSVAEFRGIPFWISEAQGGPHLSPWKIGFFDGAWEQDFLEKCFKEYVSHGAERVIFFLWRAVPGGHEFGVNGLANMDGSPSARSEAVAGILHRSRKPGGRTGAGPRAYIHYSGDSLNLALGFDKDGTSDNCYHGWYNLLTDCGYDVRFLNDESLASIEWTGNELLALPHSMVLNESLSKAIQAVVAKSATVLAGPGTGFYDPYGCCALTIPGFGLDALFGLKLEATDHVAVRCQPEILTGVKIGTRRSVSKMLDATVAARSVAGEPLVFRKEKAFFFTFDLGSVYGSTGYCDDIARWLLRVI